MRFILPFILLFICCNIQSQVLVRVQEPGLLEQQIGKDSTLRDNISHQKHVKVSGVLAKEDVHYIAAIAKEHHIKQLDLTKSYFREIGFGLFENCDSLNTIKLPNSVKTIAKNAFKNCKSLSEIVFPKNLTSVGSDAFYNCSNLQKVTINKNISWIGSNAFSGCTITHIKIKGKNRDFYVEDNHLYSKNKSLIY